MASRNLSCKTRIEYFRDLNDLIRFLKRKYHLEEPNDVERKHLEAYLAYLDQRGFKGSTRRRKVSSIKSFFSFLESDGCVRYNVAAPLVPPEREISEPRVLTEDEYKRLQLACAHEIRDSAIIELFLQTGIRVSELSNLTVHDIELPAKISKEGEPGSIHIRGKGRKERTITLNWKAAKAVKAWLAIRPQVETDALFLTKFRLPIGRRAIQYLVKRYLEQARIRGASVHSLRHTFGTQMVKRGTNLDVVRKALGHESLKTTSIYVDLAREVMDKELQEHAL